MKSVLRSFLYNGGIVLAVAILVTLSAVSFGFLKVVSHYDKWEKHAYIVMQNIDGVLSDMKDAETGQRGYLITGNDNYLEPYRSSVRHIWAQLEALRQLTKENPVQQRNVDTLGFLAGEKLSELEMTINLRKTKGFEAAREIVVTDKGKSVMDAIRLKIDRAREEESWLLQKRQKAKEDFRYNLELCLIIGGMVSLLLIVAIFILLRRENARRQAVEQKLRTYQERLEEIIETRTRALRESEERWATTLASIGDAVIATDRTGAVAFMNRVAEELTGWHFPEAAQKPVQQVFHIISEQFRKPVEDPVARVLKEGVIVGLANHTILVKKDGTEVAIDDSGAPIRDTDGNITGAVLVFRDISARRSAEEALRESESLYRSLFENMIDGFAYCRMLYEQGKPRDFVYLNVNAAFESLTGLKNVAGRKVSEVIPGIRQSDPQLFEIYGRVALTGKPERFEIYVEALKMWFSISVYSPRKEFFTAVFEVITERKQAEAMLLRSREEWVETFNLMPDLIAILDNQHRILQVNKAMADKLGIMPEQAVGLPCYRSIHGGDAPIATCPHSLMLRDRKLHVAEVHEPRLGGDYLVSVSPVFDKQGNLTGGIHVARDITERKRREEVLRRQAELIDIAHDAIIVRNADDTIAFWNHGAETMYGWTNDEAVGLVTNDLLKTRFPEPRADIMACMAKHGTWEGELTHSRKDGREIIVDSRWVVQADESGHRTGTMEINREITERKKAELALKEANALLETRNAELDSFNYSVSHDLRSPLRAIEAFDKLLQAEYGSKVDGSGKEYLDQISKAISRMAQIIDDLLKLSRITRTQINRTQVDLGAIAKAVAGELRRNDPARQVEFLIDDIVVQGDPGLMRIVIENLLSNSWKFTSKQPQARIEFSSQHESENTLFFVRDNGVGFNMEHSKKLFMPFQRLHSNSDFPGTGIGLAIVRRIIERHGGTVCAEGEVGKGATVYFEIPDVLDINEMGGR